MTKYEIWNPHLYSEDPMNENDYSQLFSESDDKRSVNMKLNPMSEKRKCIKEHDAHLYPGEKHNTTWKDESTHSNETSC